MPILELQGRATFVLTLSDTSLETITLVQRDAIWLDGTLVIADGHEWEGVGVIAGIIYGPVRTMSGPVKATLVAREAEVERAYVVIPEGHEEAAANGLAALDIVVRPVIDFIPALHVAGAGVLGHVAGVGVIEFTPEETGQGDLVNMTIGQLHLGDTDYPFFGYSTGESSAFPYPMGSSADGIIIDGHTVNAFYWASSTNRLVVSGDVSTWAGRSIKIDGEQVSTVPAGGTIVDTNFTVYDDVNDETVIGRPEFFPMGAGNKGTSALLEII